MGMIRAFLQMQQLLNAQVLVILDLLSRVSPPLKESPEYEAVIFIIEDLTSTIAIYNELCVILSAAFPC